MTWSTCGRRTQLSSLRVPPCSYIQLLSLLLRAYLLLHPASLLLHPASRLLCSAICSYLPPLQLLLPAYQLLYKVSLLLHPATMLLSQASLTSLLSLSHSNIQSFSLLHAASLLLHPASLTPASSLSYSYIQPLSLLLHPDNLSLPGGFKLGPTGQGYCDVKTATGEDDLLLLTTPFH